eukprot:TRINITY_DN7154_c0_g1_i1.p1 TRINITY_DN7154_c0_g1~~TRINITY_DN7154_c0_g1_i1.p1  ORF type:complete len:287 (+),score=17.67 TRINITY_DN7154_c0_g1_i1:85-861(+)
MSQSSTFPGAYYHALSAKINSRPLVTGTAVAATISVLWVISDFRAWKAFGTGGTPPTWSGYWRMTKIRVNRILLFGKDDLTDPSSLSTNGPTYLDPAKIPTREGARPKTQSRTMPQRQIPYGKNIVAEGVRDRVDNLVATFAAKYPDILELRPSKTEGGSTDAIYANPNLQTLTPRTKSNPILGTEIAHAHPAEGSLHLWLTEKDARTVVEKGWGERFPLSFIDKGWIMVYAPRTIAEVEVVEVIVKAAISHVTGVEI